MPYGDRASRVCVLQLHRVFVWYCINVMYNAVSRKGVYIWDVYCKHEPDKYLINRYQTLHKQIHILRVYTRIIDGLEF
jgi:hypothetical protein